MNNQSLKTIDDAETEELTRLFCELTNRSRESDCDQLNSRVDSWLKTFGVSNATELGEQIETLLNQSESDQAAKQTMLLRLIRLHKLETQFDETLQIEKLASLKQLAYGASHEVNNPLGNVATRAQTLLRSENDPERRRQLAMIVSQAFRAHDMIGDMMLYAHPPTPTFAEVDLPELVRRSIAEIESTASMHEIAIEFEIGTIDQRISADANQIVVMLKAIFQNSIDAIKQNGRIAVDLLLQLEQQGQMLGVMIEDDGPGLSELAIRHLFDPFFSGREAGRGLGFGLCKAKTISELHGGSIQCENRVEDDKVIGTRVVILLPCEK